ncbi:MAG: Peptidoglycan glycosyltransferase MrdB [Gammaproteobacteria bacterium]|nr:Peptidoglycan glycosyltransferase MrdB [Gammaproteobacteria bacterium]
MDEPRSVWQRVHVDPWLLLGLLVLCAIGLAVLYSASGEDRAMVIRQGTRMLMGLAVMVIFAQFPPAFFSRLSPLLYVAGVILLIILNYHGTGRGAHRWLDLGFMRFQPSEIMKIAVPLVCARLIAAGSLPPTLPRLLLAAVLILLPAILIAEQPDLGTGALIGVAGAVVLFLAGLRWRYIAGIAVVGLASLIPLWTMMHDYQRQRLLTLLDPEVDPLGTGYHIIQSVIAVGSGGLFGKGWLHGTQSRLEFLPERHTDFIFAVLCEEFGFIGAATLIAVYCAVIWRGLAIALAAQDSFGRLLAGSIALTLFVYVFVNVGMVIGQLPVVGVPLPFVSYGGTAAVTLMAGFGILMSIHTHRRRLSLSL